MGEASAPAFFAAGSAWLLSGWNDQNDFSSSVMSVSESGSGRAVFVRD